MATIMVREERKKIYVLDGDVPLSATHTPQEINIEIEAKAHIQSFHSYFFTLPPDDEYINYTLEKAMYLIDESGLKQKNALQEKDFMLVSWLNRQRFLLCATALNLIRNLCGLGTMEHRE